MTPKSMAGIDDSTHERVQTRKSLSPTRVNLVSVSSGVAAGRTRQVQGNAHAESWSLFATREQFDACLTTDPLRFEAPVLFTQLRREFDHVFDSPGSHEHQGACENSELRFPSP